MAKKALGKVSGPFDKYTEVLIENVGTVGVAANQTMKVMQDEETGAITFETSASKPAAPKKAPVKKATAKKK